jgi:hypothetical protein
VPPAPPRAAWHRDDGGVPFGHAARGGDRAHVSEQSLPLLRPDVEARRRPRRTAATQRGDGLAHRERQQRRGADARGRDRRLRDDRVGLHLADGFVQLPVVRRRRDDPRATRCDRGSAGPLSATSCASTASTTRATSSMPVPFREPFHGKATYRGKERGDVDRGGVTAPTRGTVPRGSRTAPSPDRPILRSCRGIRKTVSTRTRRTAGLRCR